jgi:hypothetical protein
VSRSADAEQVVEVLWNRDGSLNVRELGRRGFRFVAVAGVGVVIGALISSLS